MYYSYFLNSKHIVVYGTILQLAQLLKNLIFIHYFTNITLN